MVAMRLLVLSTLTRRLITLITGSDLSWKSHIDYLFRKLLKFTGIFYNLRCRAQPKVLRMLYFTFVYPQLLYGVEVDVKPYTLTHLFQIL